MKDVSDWDRLMHKRRDDIKQAEERGDHAMVSRLRDEHIEYECMDACIQMFRDGGRLDYYEEVAGRAEKVSPEFAKMLKTAVAKRRNLEKTRKPYDYKGTLRKMEEEVRCAEQSGDHAMVSRLRDEHIEFQCMNEALVNLPNRRQQITHYEGVAERVERVNPEFAKTLRKAAARLRNMA